MDFDVIVIGSGFGGAITSCRLAEAGYKVLILERGRRWDKSNYPRTPTDPWIWDHNHPEQRNGWLDLRVFPNMTIAQGAAVGGGSLIYANISVEPKPEVFLSGWPAEIRYDVLKPHYDSVGQFMNVQKVPRPPDAPQDQRSKRQFLMIEAANALGYGDRFVELELAVSFDPNWTYNQPDPHNPNKSVRFLNAQGVEQGTCVHLGNCDIGCDVDAKNTLDRNYIPWAERHGAEVRPHHLVSTIEPVTGGYRVSYDRLENGGRIAGSQTARLVIVAAGSLGSTEMLLRAKEHYRTLPQISNFLGRNWSSNGDFLTPAIHPGRQISPTRGPTISCAIDFLRDGGINHQKFWVEDGGLPDVIGNLARGWSGQSFQNFRAQLLITAIQDLLRSQDPFVNVMPWFAQGVDAADGQFSLRRQFFGLFGPKRLHLAWDITRSEAVFNEIVNMHTRLAQATDGTVLVPPTWSLGRDLITPHPLGGCNMGATAATGVVNHLGEVFGYRNLYVADAAIIPTALGVNPSRTIGALAERIAQRIAAEGR